MIFLPMVLIAFLWRMGGWQKAHWSGYRDILIPVLLFFYYWATCNFLVGFLTGGLANTIRIGYGAWDPEHDDKPSFLAKLTKDREGWKIRGIYGFITSFAIGIAPAIYHHTLSGFLIYVLFNTGLEIVLNKMKKGDTITELGNGGGRSLVLSLCK